MKILVELDGNTDKLSVLFSCNCVKVSILLDVNTEKASGIFGSDSLQSFGFVDLKGLFLFC